MLVPGFGIVRRLLMLLVIPGILFLAANGAIERVAEDRMGDAAKRTFGLERRPAVDVSGFPLIVNIFRGRLPGISVTAEDVDLQGMRFRSVAIELKDIAAKNGFLSSSPTLTIGTGSASAEATEKALGAYLAERDQPATVRLLAGEARIRARRPFLGRQRTFAARGVFSLRRGVLRFEPRTVTVDGEPPPRGFEAEARRRARIEVRLPSLPGGIKPTTLESHPGFLRAAARLRDYGLKLGEEPS